MIKVNEDLLVTIKNPFKLAKSMLKLAIDKKSLNKYSNKSSCVIKTFDNKISIIEGNKIIEKSFL